MAILRRATQRGLTAAALLAGAGASLQAQLVRGTVRDATTNAPLSGVVVSIHPASGRGDERTTLAATLTNARGDYALTPNDTGHFVISAKRIGVRQYRSAPLHLGRGTTERLDIALEGLTFTLPVVTVSGATPCASSRNDRERIAALWEEARAALTASELALRNRLVRASLTRYERVLEPRSLAIRSERRSTMVGATERAFVSTPAESLAVHGYARRVDGGEIEYFAPDERVLLSDVFVRDHCFSLAPRAASGEVGIAFEPTRARRLTDIAGTLWLDARTFELRRLVFRYTNFPSPVQDPRTGGEVHFTKLNSGIWLISRWFMRAPNVAMEQSVSGTMRSVRVMSDRAVLSGFSESGGSAVAEGEEDAAAMARLSGRVVDSTGGAPLGGGRIAVAGLDVEVPVRLDGSFHLPPLAAGRYTLIATHPDYDRFAIYAAEQVLDLAGGTESTTLIQAVSTSQILRQLCGDDQIPDSITVARFILPPPPAADAGVTRTLHLSWPVIRALHPGVAGGMVRTTTMAVDLPIDQVGGATACSLPREKRLTIEERFANGALARRYEATTSNGALQVLLLRAS